MISPKMPRPDHSVTARSTCDKCKQEKSSGTKNKAAAAGNEPRSGRNSRKPAPTVISSRKEAKTVWETAKLERAGSKSRAGPLFQHCHGFHEHGFAALPRPERREDTRRTLKSGTCTQREAREKERRQERTMGDGWKNAFLLHSVRARGSTRARPHLSANLTFPGRATGANQPTRKKHMLLLFFLVVFLRFIARA